MKPPFAWDAYSDQPCQLKDRGFKKALRRPQRFSLIKTALSGLLWLPLAVLSMPFLRRSDIDAAHFFGLIIDPLREPARSKNAVESLRNAQLLVRVAMWEPERLETLAAYVSSLGRNDLFFVLMQDRECATDTVLRRERFHACFKALSPFGSRFQIGTTPNRAKWGFASMNEYLAFYTTAQQVRDEAFGGLELIGPGVIDFEYHFTAHALFNLSGAAFDAVASLLYVDRRGAPENTQAGCDLACKINLLAALAMLSPRARSALYITETNWPITGTAPYAPTSEKECVDEEAHASYLVRYYLLTLASQQVRTVYWHQLAAPGYGLVDTREGWRERPAYAAFRTLCDLVSDARYLSLKQQRRRYEMLLAKPGGLLHVFWSNGEESVQPFAQTTRFIDRDGTAFDTDMLTIGDAPVYLYVEDAP